ncbi:MAG: YggS family pyridoxal phosphate-dependent enzyme [Burkholderiales bacterium]
MALITENLQATRAQIDAAISPDNHAVTLIAVTKSQSIDLIEKSINAGQRIFGENYVQEALTKINALRNYRLEWHFIGPIQSNKTRQIAENFDWVQSVDRLKIAERLNDARPPYKARLNICLQVNVSGETSKSGVAPGQLEELARQVASLPRLHLRGLMAIPEAVDNETEQRRVFRELKNLFEQLKQKGYPLDTLSMGMSGDYKAAIAEGATHVRIGTAIFGEREKSA